MSFTTIKFSFSLQPRKPALNLIYAKSHTTADWFREFVVFIVYFRTVRNRNEFLQCMHVYIIKRTKLRYRPFYIHLGPHLIKEIPTILRHRYRISTINCPPRRCLNAFPVFQRSFTHTHRSRADFSPRYAPSPPYSTPSYNRNVFQTIKALYTVSRCVGMCYTICIVLIGLSICTCQHCMVTSSMAFCLSPSPLLSSTFYRRFISDVVSFTRFYIKRTAVHVTHCDPIISMIRRSRIARHGEFI